MGTLTAYRLVQQFVQSLVALSHSRTLPAVSKPGSRMKLKVVYPNFRGRAEKARLMLHAAGQDFEDYRFPVEKFNEEKDKSPNKKLPYLEVDGNKIPQSQAMDRFIAREFKMMGGSNFESFCIEAVHDECNDMYGELLKCYFEKDEAKKKVLKDALLADKIPEFLKVIEMYIQKNDKKGHVVGDKLTLADIAVFDILDSLVQYDSAVMSKAPKAKEVHDCVAAVDNLKSYLSTRAKDGP